MMNILEKAALEAGRAILDIHARGAQVMFKADCSPVTEADRTAETIILSHLADAFADIPVIAEESVAAGRIPDIGAGRFFLVDPLDGTKEFIARNGDFTVNIALIEAGVPVAGVVYAPACGRAYSAAGTGAEKLEVTAGFTVASRTAIGVRPCPTEPVALVSRSHNSPETLAFLDGKGIAARRVVGSSLKFCLLAEGAADVYPRFSRTMEWDTAAGDAILRIAGGTVTDIEGAPLCYGKPGFANPFFIATGGLPA
ncbi:3'(2'),5'-bisphosphate nucleotidase CysQ [Rhizobiaceae bacterium BDR2-2]|uniref:3'(2'),5'-bisphosphate nucleotidase CysQ n=1 Tax=Ectorhizobium quercum TaxID=2965071 RepID=A0AAE3MZL7_9HYPH|nr:3'(2'),5'-bisphosphate nucleotidase CysQ [Ectorhizobium quercum]MCX8998023.1 3'(2'),5'-bisphosphate nucleotidase CysQ [Ectorhizobium quercum]